MSFRTVYSDRATSFEEAFGDPDGPAMPFVAETVSSLRKKQDRLNAMFDKLDNDGMNTIYGNSLEQFGFVTPDATEMGSFRYTLFDRKGFFSHATFKTAEEAMYELCDAGFVRPAPVDTLAKMTQILDWILGTEALSLRTAVQNGLISLEAAECKFAEFKLKHESNVLAA